MKNRPNRGGMGVNWLSMKKIAVLICLVCSAVGLAQSSPCVILSTNEPAKGMATWSREGRSHKDMLTYLAGDFPPGMPFRSQIKDKMVDKIKERGGRVIILDSHYTREDLENAKQDCSK